ncbi:hypothetical protein RIF29_23979 [Crotalaria pallida]|uniref:Uncharacterized protein n=1 Tax=Crotalaria pallida TaxID=3830 RepID=A0AAN9EIZ5_CROPI
MFRWCRQLLTVANEISFPSDTGGAEYSGNGGAADFGNGGAMVVGGVSVGEGNEAALVLDNPNKVVSGGSGAFCSFSGFFGIVGDEERVGMAG